MRKKQISKITAISLAAVMTLSLAACGGGKTPQSEPTETQQQKEEKDPVQSEEGKEASEAKASVPNFEDITFPEAMPEHPTLAEDDYYDYDDMDKHYELTFYTYNYGTDLPPVDPIRDWLEETYNVTLNLVTTTQPDMETYLSTVFVSGEIPDLITLPVGSPQNFGFALGEQGLLLDAREIYPYLPQTCKFVTQTLLDWSTMPDGMIPFLTKYSIQDTDVWGLAIRQDWLDNLNMSMPTTMEELKEYARACTYDDPDGNGQDDTWFMTGAGAGASFGMLDAFHTFFGNTSNHAEDGKLVSPMLDGTTKEWISFLKELNDMGVLAPDWFTIDWATAASYTMNDRVGMVNYPAGSLYLEYVNAHNSDYSRAAVWKYLDDLPKGTKGLAGGNYGICFAIPSQAVKEDEGKLKRICHILDAMCYGGEAYFATVQHGGNEVFDDYNDDVREYLEDGTSYCYFTDHHPAYQIAAEYGTTLEAWQNFGYTSKWQVTYCPEDADEAYKTYVECVNDGIRKLAGYDRYNNDALLLPNTSDIAPTLGDYMIAQEYKFVMGNRPMDEWDSFVKEWLNQGGREILRTQAEALGVGMPDGVE